jgi:predicted permease
MRWWNRLFNKRTLEHHLDAELRYHFERKVAEHVAGLSEQEARRLARLEFGGLEQVKEECRDARGMRWIEDAIQDVRYALRGMRRNPGFTAVAVVSLALGIGANTAIFSVVNAVLLRPLPYPEPAQLVRVGRQATQGGDVTMPEYEFWKEHSSSFVAVAGHRGGGERRLLSGTGQEWIQVMTVTADFLRTLGVNPALGREFNSEETRLGGPQAIILSDSLWRRSFGADREVLGRAVTLDGRSHVIVGVLPPNLWFPESAEALVPLGNSRSLADAGTNTQLIARLQAGVSLRQAQAEMATVTENFRRAYPGDATREYRGLMVIPYHDWLAGNVRLNLLLLFGATGLLLLIACSNLVSLLLTRLSSRGKEIAVRLALGSSRSRLLRQFLVENLLLAGLGAAAGLFTAYGLLGGLVSFLPFHLPIAAPIQVDGVILAFTLAITVSTALLFTFVPLLSAAHLNLHDALKSVGRIAGFGSARQRIRNVLVVGEVALSAMLLAGAGLLIQSLYRVHQERLGFTPQELITFQTPLAPERRQNTADRLNFTRAMLERLQAAPGVRGVAATNVLPLTGWSNLPTQRHGHPDQSIGGMEIRPITPAYFELMGIPVLRGRSFAESDSSAPVAVINESLARTWWPEGDAIGDRLIVGRFQGREFGKDSPREVIGIVGDTKTSLKELPRPTVFVPMTQAGAFPPSSLAWIVRSSGSAGLAEELRRVVTDIDPGQRIRQLRTMDEIVASSTARSRFDAWLFGLFAGVALALAAIGVYGLLSFSVSQRRQEIGTRLALGAAGSDILRLVLQQGLVLTFAGLVFGLAGAVFLSRTLASLLHGIRPNDPLNLAAVSLVLLGVGVVASFIPARRATKIDPIVTLRYE